MSATNSRGGAAPTSVTSAAPPPAGQGDTPPSKPSVTLQSPIIFNSIYGSYIYDVATQDYYTQLQGQWLHIHKTPQTTISKSEAKPFLKSLPSLKEAMETFPNRFNIQPSQHAILRHEIIIYNAMNDSILVKRDKSTTSLIQYYLDKFPTPYIKSLPLVLVYLRPKCNSTHSCLELQTYGNVIYCKDCCEYSVPVSSPQSPAITTTTTTTTLTSTGETLTISTDTTVIPTARATLPVGKLTLPQNMVDLISQYCADPKTKKFNQDATFTTCNTLLQLSELNNISVPKEILLGWIFRDSLFVQKLDGKVVSWGEYFKVGKENGFTTDHAVTLLRLGLAVGTLGMIS